MKYDDLRKRTWVGIDFGTVWSKGSVCHPGGEPKLVPLEASDLHQSFECPTAVFVDEAEALKAPAGRAGLVVGRPAVLRGVTNPGLLFERFKPDIGRPETVPVPGLPGRYRWVDFVAAVLDAVKRRAEDAHNSGRPLTAVVLTVPAIYVEGGAAWRVMDEAARAVGFEEVIIIREPESAGVFLSHRLAARGGALKEGDLLLVYDLGGGTFDPVFIQKHGDTFKTFPLTTADGLRCGGIYFDERVYEDLRLKCPEAFAQLAPGERDAAGYVLPAHEARHRRYLNDVLRLRELSVKAKMHLSEHDTFGEDEPIAFARYELTRAGFNALIGPMIDDTVECCRALARRWRIEWAAVQRIVLVGGSCYIPLVRERLQRHCAELNCGHIEVCWRTSGGVDLDPLHAVALGASAYPFQLPRPEALVDFGRKAAAAGGWDEAEFYFHRAVNYDSAEAMAWLGKLCCRVGRRSHRRALEWFRRADAAGSGEGAFWLGYFAFRGWGTRKSNAAARAHLTDAVSRGHGPAKQALGELLYWGYGGPADTGQAARNGYHAPTETSFSADDIAQAPTG